MSFCGMPPLCHAPPGDQTDGPASSSPAPVPDGAGAAVVCTDVIWAGRQVLKVYFLNPHVLTGWPMNLTTEIIIEWANGTTDRRAWKEVMEFKETNKREKADIRVEFSEKEISWSMIGMCGAKVKDPKPTMVLNLIDPIQCPSASARRSLVIHEFGHALGLSHEHQRVDFWETVKPFMDLRRMMDDERVKRPISEYGKQTIGTDWGEQSESHY